MLKPDKEQGLIAEIKHNDLEITLHFTPDYIKLKEDIIEGKLKLLQKPELKSDSLIYNALIAGCKIFLGGKIPQLKLSENVKVDGEQVFYTFPRSQIKLLEVLFKSVQSDSTLITNLEQGVLTIKTNVSSDLAPSYKLLVKVGCRVF